AWATGEAGSSPARPGRRAATAGETYWKKQAVRATTSVVDSSTGQKARSPGTRAGVGPDQAARNAAFTRRHAAARAPRYPGGTARGDQAPRRWSRVRIQAAVATNAANSTPCQGVRTGSD